MTRRLLLTAAALACLFRPDAEAATAERARYLMGSACRIVASHPEPGAAERLVEAAFQEIDRWNGILSDYDPGSELSRLNAAPPGTGFRCSADLFSYLEQSLALAARTEGAFDPTVGTLVDLYALRQGGRWPSTGEIDSALKRTGFARVELIRDRLSAHLLAAGMRLDPGANGKGFALDAAAEILRAGGVQWALLDFGGQVLAVGGGPGGHGFPVEIPGAGGEAGRAPSILLRDASAATTSNTERGLVVDGRPLGHILDPRTALPVEDRGSLTVVAPSAAAADALSTALFVMGPEDALAAASRLSVEARYLPAPGTAGRPVATDGFRHLLERTTAEASPAAPALSSTE
jgi:thiamine biosynthesis lipoprotein